MKRRPLLSHTLPRQRWCVAALAVPALIWSTGFAPAQEEKDASRPAEEMDEQDAESAELKRWIAYYQRVADAYEIRLRDELGPKLAASPHPLMTFAHPWDGGQTHGAFFVWTHEGCAQLIGAIWSWGRPDQPRLVTHEFHSLATEPLAPVKVGPTTWRPVSGIELRPIPDASPPKASPALRLAQMRSLAREFTGFSTPHGKELRLRTLDQPLYRYDSESAEVIDGAVFGMFAEWDPDIILTIEARKNDDEIQWMYGYGRFNGCPLRLEHRGVEVWREGLVPLRNSASCFFAVRANSLLAPLADP